MAAIHPYEAMTCTGKVYLSELFRQWESGDEGAAYKAALDFAEAVGAGEVFSTDYLPGRVYGSQAFVACPDFPPET